jgi:UDP-N-acetylmuramoyl-tripeptide--D-alanyl-D-alanine ligase
VKTLNPERIAAETGAEIVRRGEEWPPRRVQIDSREVAVGDLFIGLRGSSFDGAQFAPTALAGGAWGVIVEPGAAAGLGKEGHGWVLAAADPLEALGRLARAWRRELGARAIGITGSVGKTSVKDIAASLLPGRVHASEENFNTEIGLPLTVLSAPEGTEVLVLEMAMRGKGQIAELAAIAEPEVAVITNVGPVHVELLGSVEAVAAAKAEVLGFLPADGAAVVPARAGELEAHLGAAPRLIRFGEGGEVSASEVRVREDGLEALVSVPGSSERLSFPFTEAHNLENALAAIAAGVAIGATLEQMSHRTSDIGFSRLRGERLELGDGIVLVNDCYNANPLSMRAALDHLASLDARRRIAVLGEMGELGPESAEFHRETGEHARSLAVDYLIGVGAPARDYGPDDLVATPEEAAELLVTQLGAGDAVLVKGSRSAGMEAVAEALEELLDD